MKRSEHRFEFRAGQIADAAAREARFHVDRIDYWRRELDASVEVVRATAAIKIVEQDVTGGKRIDVAVDHGDLAAYRRMQEAQGKIREHAEALERLSVEAEMYASQERGRIYELDADDVAYFGLVAQVA